MDFKRLRPSPAMVVAVIALVMATVGGAVAGSLITGAQVQNNSLTGADIRNASLGVVELTPAARTSLRGRRGAAGARGPQGAQGAQGTPGAVGPPGAVGSVGAVGPAGAVGPPGTPGTNGTNGTNGAPGASIFSGPVPSGQTITGSWGTVLDSPDAAGAQAFFLEAFPVRAPVALIDATIGIGVNNSVGVASALITAATRNADEDVTCTGNFTNPTAPAGLLCVYVRESQLVNIQPNSISVFPLEAGTSPANTFGFAWRFQANLVTTDARTEGTWAYTAP